MISVKDIINCTNGKLIAGALSDFCDGVSIDSRTIKKGEVFIALEGKNFNGHNFIKQALKKGASGFIYSESIDDISFCNKSKFAIRVKDTLYSLGEIAAFYRRKHNPKVVAITGSAGKTTTKNLISTMLSYKFRTCKNHKTQNNLVGVPLNILHIDSSCEVLVLELGTNQPGEIDRLAKICQPDIGILLNIGPSHLEHLGSLKGVEKEKMSLFDNLKKRQGYAIINSDYVNAGNMKDDKKITFGIKKDADFKAKNINFLNNGVQFSVNKEKYFMSFKSVEYIYNILACITVASIFDVEKKYLTDTISGVKNILSGRFYTIEFEDFSLIDDSYNSNPLSVQCALNGINRFKGYKRKIFVCGDMLELGNDSERLHYNIGRLIADSDVNLLFIIGKFSAHVKKGALDNGMNRKNIEIFKSIEELYNKLILEKREKDLWLIKASRRMSLDILVKKLEKEFKGKKSNVDLEK